MIICLIVILVIVIFLVATYNRLVFLHQKVEQSLKLIDVYLKQRFDLIPNLVETVKEYKKYENSTLKEIVDLRSKFDSSIKDDVDEQANLNTSYNQILANMESYPELKANEGFLNLQKQLSKMESQLQAARRIYNSDVTNYNIKIMSFPSNIVASLFKFKEAKLFEAKAIEKNNIEVKV